MSENRVKPLNVTLRQLRAFLAGTGSASFSEAASRSNLTQPGFSLLIRQLEAELGVKLFDRTTRRVELTTIGRTLGERLDGVLSKLDDVLDEARRDVARERGHVVLGLLPSVGASIIGEVYARVSSEHPGIELTLREDQAVPLTQAVADNLVDFAIGAAAGMSRDLAFTPLIDDPMVFVLHPDEPILANEDLRWHDVFALPYIAFAQSAVQERVERALQMAGIVADPITHVKTAPTAICMIRSRIGFTILPELALSAADTSNLTILPMSPTVATRKVGIITNAQRSLSPAATLVRESVRQVARSFAQKQREQSAARRKTIA